MEPNVKICRELQHDAERRREAVHELVKLKASGKAQGVLIDWTCFKRHPWSHRARHFAKTKRSGAPNCARMRSPMVSETTD